MTLVITVKLKRDWFWTNQRNTFAETKRSRKLTVKKPNTQ